MEVDGPSASGPNSSDLEADESVWRLVSPESLDVAVPVTIVASLSKSKSSRDNSGSREDPLSGGVAERRLTKSSLCFSCFAFRDKRSANDFLFFCRFVTFGSGDVLGLMVAGLREELERRLGCWRLDVVDIIDVVFSSESDMLGLENRLILACPIVGDTHCNGSALVLSSGGVGGCTVGAVDGRSIGFLVPEESHRTIPGGKDAEGPIVLGLALTWSCSSAGPGRDRGETAGGGLDVPPLTRDVMLLVTEWLARTVDMLLDVSDEMVDKGRGMYSRTSENSTARDRISSLVLKDLHSVIGTEGVVNVVVGWDMD